MAIVSSHVLDAVAGNHAAGIRVTLQRVDAAGARVQLFDETADHEGRIMVEVEVDATTDDYELVFHCAAYFAQRVAPDHDRRLVKEVVVRLQMPDPDARYHMPVVLSPHAYTVWWPA